MVVVVVVGVVASVALGASVGSLCVGTAALTGAVSATPTATARGKHPLSTASSFLGSTATLSTPAEVSASLKF